MNRDVIAVGCNHVFQCDDGRGDARLNHGRSEFRAFIESLVNERGIKFIGEESHDRYKSFAREVAEQKRVRWMNIDVPRDIRDKLGVPEDGHGHPDIISEEYSEAWNKFREWYMIREFRNEICDAKSAMVICGRSHLEAIDRELGRHNWLRLTCVCFRLRHPDEQHDR